ncbi:MAG: DUF3524 domain-containing protein [Gammaproteobacteria bacterium]|nr:DUF3524 domain-containing protein [Gammaproteobacteria bacterium]
MKNNKKTILLLSAYRSNSHAAWADWLVNTFSEFEWLKLELPGRHFRWRIRGNPLSWLYKLPAKKPDLILATSMVDLATLKGLHSHLSNIPCIYYFHENQFAYPTSKQQHDSIDPQMVQLYGALAADKLLFNSVYNQQSFLNGVDRLLNLLPDETPENINSLLKSKSDILPVAITPIEKSAIKIPQLILWNHRWEYDKAPQVFADALEKLNKMDIDFQLALLGDRPAKKPASLLQIEKQFSDKIIINNKASKEDYLKYLSLSSVVVSTAIHEFQGLSMLEAVSAGAIPVVPDDLCYKEQYASHFRYKAGDSDALSEKLYTFLTTKPEIPDISKYFDENLKSSWYELLNS